MLTVLSSGIILEKCKGNDSMEPKQSTLRPILPEDQAVILEILTSGKVNQTYMLPDFESKDAAIPLFTRLMSLSKDPDRFVRCIALEDTAVGFLNDVEIKNGCIELGYVIHPKFHNKGYMTHALKLAIGQHFELGYAKVECGAFEENKASQRVMEKAGMVKIEKTEQIEYRGKIHNCVYYEIRNRKGD